jgi:hypothetical protein
MDGSTTLTTLTLSGGSATYSDNALSVGSHAITASYSGDSNFLSANSSTLTQQVNLASSSVGIASSSPSTVFGQATTLTANVSEVLPGQGIPTGTVTFYDGTTPLQTVSLTNGVANFSVVTLAVGTHALTAQYNGDSHFSSSTSGAITQTVGLASSQATDSSPGATVFGQSVTLTASLSAAAPGSGIPGGLVVFEDGSTPIGTGTLNGSGVATYTTSSLSIGTHEITVVYGGNNSFLGTTSSAYAQVVGQSSTTVNLVSATNPTVFGQTATFTATVTATSPGAGIPTGTVTFYDGTTALGTETVDNSGVAVDPVSSLSFGTHQITAVYSGDTNFGTSTSNIVAQVVNTANSSLSLVSSANPSVYGQPITFTVTASSVPPGSGTPSESVSLSVDSTVIATISVRTMLWPPWRATTTSMAARIR